jgi:RNA 3'-terminal phosphate cyclase (ATP)
MPEAIHIDGRQGEGGGQILRTSLALAALLRQPVTIDNIRANREQPGLKTQHLAGVLALARITDAEVIGAHKHSTRLDFAPRTLKGGKYRFEITTAGAASMLFGAVLPALLFAPQPSEVTITGGTHVPFSPPFHYLEKVFLPAVRKLGGRLDLVLVRWGFYPKGGGEMRARVNPGRGLHGVELTKRGKLQSLEFSACSSAHLAGHIVRREVAQAEKRLTMYTDRLTMTASECESYSPGNFVFLKAGYEHTTAGFSALGKRGKPAEEVAEEACRYFNDFEKTAATVDSHLADQLILYTALALGDSFFITEKVTSHLTTNIAVIRKFLPVEIDLNATTGQVSVKGTGHKAPE